MNYELLKELGTVGIVAIPLFFLIKWIAEEFKALLVREYEERQKWLCVIQGFQKAIDEHSEQARTFHRTVEEANRYQRDEHKQMIETLGRINGYKHE